MDPLLQTIGELASATTLEAVALAVRLRARALVKADGVTFVLRENDSCYYLDEDAIAPQPTFVKSLAMVPAPQNKAVAAIGAYWSQMHEASWGEQYVLQALANAAGVALQSMRLYAELSPGGDKQYPSV